MKVSDTETKVYTIFGDVAGKEAHWTFGDFLSAREFFDKMKQTRTVPGTQGRVSSATLYDGDATPIDIFADVAVMCRNHSERSCPGDSRCDGGGCWVEDHFP